MKASNVNSATQTGRTSPTACTKALEDEVAAEIPKSSRGRRLAADGNGDDQGRTAEASHKAGEISRMIRAPSRRALSPMKIVSSSVSCRNTSIKVWGKRKPSKRAEKLRRRDKQNSCNNRNKPWTTIKCMLFGAGLSTIKAYARTSQQESAASRTNSSEPRSSRKRLQTCMWRLSSKLTKRPSGGNRQRLARMGLQTRLKSPHSRKRRRRSLSSRSQTCKYSLPNTAKRQLNVSSGLHRVVSSCKNIKRDRTPRANGCKNALQMLVKQCWHMLGRQMRKARSMVLRKQVKLRELQRQAMVSLARQRTNLQNDPKGRILITNPNILSMLMTRRGTHV